MKLAKFDPDFDFKRNFIGSKGRNIRHIQGKSCSKVEIDQSDDEAPIFITVSAGTKANCNHGIELCHDLFCSIRDDYLAWLDESRDDEFVKELELEVFDPAFHFKRKLLGSNGRNILRIQDITRSKVEIDQLDDDAPILITVIASKKEYCNHGFRLCQDLVNSIRDEYLEWVDD